MQLASYSLSVLLQNIMDTRVWNIYLLAISVLLQQCLRGYGQTITCPVPCTLGNTCAMVRHGNAPPAPGCIDSTEAMMLQQAMGGGPSGPGSPVGPGARGLGLGSGPPGFGTGPPGFGTGGAPGLGLGFPPSRGFPSPQRETLPNMGILGLQGGRPAGPGFLGGPPAGPGFQGGPPAGPGFQDRFGQGIRGQSPEAFAPMAGIPQGLPSALAPAGAFLDPITGRTVGSMPAMPSAMGTVPHSHGLVEHTHLPDGSVRAVSRASNPRRQPGVPPLQIPLGGGGGGQTDPGGGSPGVINPPASRVPDVDTLAGSSTNTNPGAQSPSQGRATTIRADQHGAYYIFFPTPTSLGIRVNFTKPGFCSRQDANTPDRAFCMNMCYSDSQCPDLMKCCPSGCSLGCISPIAPRGIPANIGTPTAAPSGTVPPRVDCSVDCRFHTDCPAQDFCGLNEGCGQRRVCQRMSI